MEREKEMIGIKHILIGTGAAALLWGARYVLTLNRLSNELETVTKVTVHKVSLSGIDLKINVTLKNPSGGTVKVKYPFVKLLYKSSTVATSQVKDVNITIPKYSEINLEPLMVNIDLVSLVATAPALFKEYRSTGKMALTVRIVSTINDRLPYVKEDMLTLAGGKKA